MIDVKMTTDKTATGGRVHKGTATVNEETITADLVAAGALPDLPLPVEYEPGKWKNTWSRVVMNWDVVTETVGVSGYQPVINSVCTFQVLDTKVEG